MSVTQIKNTSFFQPTVISGCQLWMDAVDTSSMTLSGSNVTVWTDKSGNGRNATGGVSPTLATNGITFNGTSQYLATTYSSVPSSESVFVVVTWTGTTNRFYCIIGTSETLGRNYNVLKQSSGINSITWDRWAVGNYAPTPGILADVRFMSSGIYNGSTGTTGLNGGTQSSSAAFTFSGNGITHIGTGVLGDWFTGTIHEIIVYNSALTTTQRQQMEGYLAWKWGLQQSLPSTHPFARTPSFATALYFPKAVPKITGTIGKHPVFMAGLQLWLDAADTSTLVLSGSSVTQWNDKSGNGNNGTANTPVALNSAINNLPALTFTTSEYIGGNISITGNTLTVFSTFKVSSLPQFGRVISLASLGGDDYSNTSSTAILNYGSAAMGPMRVSQYVSSATPLNTSVVHTVYFDGTNAYVYTNGGTPSSMSSSGNFSVSRYNLGRSTNTGDTYSSFSGFTGEVIIYNTLLTATQRQEVEGYLAWKWGLQSSLAAGHSYQTVVPIVIPYVNPVVRRIITIDSPIRIITSGLVSRWQLNESSGSTVIDSVGGNNITIGGSPSRVSVTYGSYTGYALSLQTTSQVGSIGLPSNMNVTAHSMTSWVYFTAIRSGSQQRWLSWGTNGCGGGGQDFATYLDSIYSGPTCIVAYGFLNSGLTTGVWYFCTSTYNGTTWTTYLNGTQVQTANAGLNAVNGFFSIGYNRDSAQTLGGNGGGGYLGEIRFYNRALTASEVLQIYQRTG